MSIERLFHTKKLNIFVGVNGRILPVTLKISNDSKLVHSNLVVERMFYTASGPRTFVLSQIISKIVFFVSRSEIILLHTAQSLQLILQIERLFYGSRFYDYAKKRKPFDLLIRTFVLSPGWQVDRTFVLYE